MSPLVADIAIAHQQHQGRAFCPASLLLLPTSPLSVSVPRLCLRPSLTLSPTDHSTIPHSTACFMIPTVLGQTRVHATSSMHVQVPEGTRDSSNTSTNSRPGLYLRTPRAHSQCSTPRHISQCPPNHSTSARKARTRFSRIRCPCLPRHPRRDLRRRARRLLLQ
jgi:hypothetical protein